MRGSNQTMICRIIFISLLLVICSSSPDSNCKVFCNLCQQGLTLIQRNIEAIESVTQDQLIGFVDQVCNVAPNLDLIQLICHVAKDDVIDAVNKLLEFLKKNPDPAATCHQLTIC